MRLEWDMQLKARRCIPDVSTPLKKAEGLVSQEMTKPGLTPRSTRGLRAMSAAIIMTSSFNRLLSSAGRDLSSEGPAPATIT
jgi:hypothetical protein